MKALDAATRILELDQEAEHNEPLPSGRNDRLVSEKLRHATLVAIALIEAVKLLERSQGVISDLVGGSPMVANIYDSAHTVRVKEFLEATRNTTGGETEDN